MIVRFDSLNRYEVPLFTLCNPGSVCVDGIPTNIVGILSDTSDEEIVFNFNSISELNLRVTRVLRDDPDENAHTYDIYKAIQNRRLIYADGLGYFLISDVVDGYDEHGACYKDISAKSCEVEIQNKMIPFIGEVNGDSVNYTYKFNDLLDKLVSSLPLWSISYIDSSLGTKYRTFEDVSEDQNILAFMLENMQEAYECIFIFDNINRRISAYDQENYVRLTDIHITKNDLINTISVSEKSEDLYTALTVLGSDDLGISSVNPIGTNTIYNFDNYTGWMTEALRKKVDSWKTTVLGKEKEYADLNKTYYKLLTEQSDLKAEVDRCDSLVTIYQRCYENISNEIKEGLIDEYNVLISESDGVEIEYDGKDIATLQNDVKSLLAAAKTAMAQASAKLASKIIDVNSQKNKIDAIHDMIAIEKFFVTGEDTSLLDELSNYIYEGSYTDDYIIVTDSMSFDEKFEQMQTLYERAKKQHKKISKPTQEFSIGVENFLFRKDFQHFSEQLETGCLINVELDVDDVAQLFLTNITVNFSDQTLSMTFGNRFNKFDTKSLYDNVLGNISKTANTLNYVKDILYPIKNGELSEMREFLQTSRDLTLDSAIASKNEDVIIDATGYLGRKLLSNGEYDSRQIKITSNNILFTNDAWDSCATAIGEIILDDNNTTYGINAQTIMGNMIIGDNLFLSNSANTMQFNNNGLTIKNNKSYVSINPNDSNKLFSIGNNTSSTPLLYLDANGMLHISGDGAGIDISSNSSITGLGARITTSEDGMTVKINQKAEELTEEFDEKIDGLSISVTNGEKSSTLSLKSGSATLSSQSITFTGAVTFSDLSTSGKTNINGSNITTGTLNAANININGRFKTFNGTSQSGYIGYMTGSADDATTHGIGMSNNDTSCYSIVTTNGARLQAGSASLYVYKQEKDGETIGLAVIDADIKAKKHLSLEGNNGQKIEFLNCGYVSEEKPGTTMYFYKALSSDPNNAAIGLYDDTNKRAVWYYRPDSNAFVVSSTFQDSDRNKKKDILPLNIDIIDKLKPVQFRMINGGDGIRFGFIAQDVEESLCEAGVDPDSLSIVSCVVDENGNKNNYTLAYTEFIPMLVKRVQLLQERIEQLEKNIE